MTGSIPRGMFLTVEGGEGAGKSTQMDVIEAVLREKGIQVLRTREPGGTPLAEEIRTLLLEPREEPVAELTELLLVFAARAQHLTSLIRPALARGEWVLSDRFVDATLAYQGAGRGMSEETIAALRHLVLDGFSPDFTLLLDVPAQRGLERAAARGERDRFEREARDFHERVRECYLGMARSEPHRISVVDASAPLVSVTAAVRSAVAGFVDRIAGAA
jgi:dTMP kinase